MKFVLFDLDGTLIDYRGARAYEMTKGENKFSYAIRKVFGFSVVVDFSKHIGSIDKKTLWVTASSLGVERGEFDRRLPDLEKAMLEYFMLQQKNTKLYRAIPHAKKFVTLLKAKRDTYLGVLTGNIPSIANWKLKTGGYEGMFGFGLFGDEAEDRIALSKSVFAQARDYFHMDFPPDAITVIGDTIHDIRCGKAIAAHTIGVSTLGEGERNKLKQEGADIVVDSLMDTKVLQFFDV